MGISSSKKKKENKVEDKVTRINEKYTGHASKVPVKIINKISKSICRILYEKISGTGFFMLLNDSLKCIITNYHIISKELINKIINIELSNDKKIEIELKNRFIKFDDNLDITIVEVKESDGITEDILFLDYDLNYLKGYEQYLNVDVFTLQYPKNYDISFASGKIVEIYDNEFKHSIDTEYGSSGSPIILTNTLKVIGIHKQGDKIENINYGSFFGEILNEIKNKLIKNINMDNIKNNRKLEDKKCKIENNYIIGKIFISEKDIGKEKRIINSYEDFFSEFTKRRISLLEEEYKNEEEIKECKIEINNKIIPFCYFYKFEKSGNYIIKYIFKTHLRKINKMFSHCSFTYLDLSNFNTEDVTNMSSLFYGCDSLININLSNFNTQNVIDMSHMFDGCKSLINLDLSNFNNQKVSIMNNMFSSCSSLSKINLSNFNTQNVIDMSWMFSCCDSLIDLNLSYFNTINVIDMSSMFAGCFSLTNLNLSNFNTNKVTNMNKMFTACSSLTNLNLMNFNTEKVIDMEDMFTMCNKLELIITKDSKIGKLNPSRTITIYENCSNFKLIST